MTAHTTTLMEPHTLAARADDASAKLAKIRQRIEEASRTTASAVERARDAVACVRDEARRYVGNRVVRLTSARASDPLTKAFADLERCVTLHLDAVLEQVERQQELAQRAASRCGDIMEGVTKLDRVAGAAKLLSLNASVGASALAEGRTIAVLAVTLSALTQEVALINRRASTTATRLLAVLPEVEAKAERLRETALEFSRQFQAEVGRLRPIAETMNRIADESSVAGDRRIEAILAKSGEALSALDFGKDLAVAMADLQVRTNGIEDTVSRERTRPA